MAPDRLEPLLESARRESARARRVGTTGGRALTLDGADAICLDELARVHGRWLPALMAAPGATPLGWDPKRWR